MSNPSDPHNLNPNTNDVESESDAPQSAIDDRKSEILSQADLERLAGANRAPRCVHVKSNGVRCGSPAMHNIPWCYFHNRFYNRPYEDTLPALEDANAIQIAIMQVLDGLRSGRLDRLTAQTYIYALRVAAIVNRSANFNPHPSRVVIEDPAMSDRRKPAFIPIPETVPSISASADTRTQPSSATRRKIARAASFHSAEGPRGASAKCAQETPSRSDHLQRSFAPSALKKGPVSTQ